MMRYNCIEDYIADDGFSKIKGILESIALYESTISTLKVQEIGLIVRQPERFPLASHHYEDGTIERLETKLTNPWVVAEIDESDALDILHEFDRLGPIISFPNQVKLFFKHTNKFSIPPEEYKKIINCVRTKIRTSFPYSHFPG
jgi:hypothetical protein